MTLARWLEKSQMSQSDFAKLSGISQSLLSKYLSDDPDQMRRPNVDQALKIERVTKGAVPVEEWESTDDRKAV